MEPIFTFLTRLRKRIEPQRNVRNITIPAIRSPEVMDSFEPDFFADLRKLFTPRALNAMDYLALNEYWFIMMAAAALAITEQVPANACHVQEGIFHLRRRLATDPRTDSVFAKLLSNNADRLSRAEMEIAQQEGLIMCDADDPRLMRVNLVFFKHTGELCADK